MTETRGDVMMRLVFLSLLATVVWAAPVRAVTIDFETPSDSEPVTTQFPGLTFANATVLTAGITLNEFEFPPRSGVNVVFDDGGPMTISFDALQASVGGFFTYLVPLTLNAFDALDLVLGTAPSAFSSNLALSGDPGSGPNEFLGLAFATGIKSVRIQGDPAGSSFVLDDLTFSPLSTAVPAPATLLLFSAGLAGGLAWRGVRQAVSRHHT